MAKDNKGNGAKPKPEAPEPGVSLTVPDEGPPVIVVDLAVELTLALSKELRASVADQVEALEGRSFTILMDTRPVTSAEEGAMDQLQQLEMESAGRGLERVAHVVRFPEMKEKLAATYRELGYPDLYGTFTDREEALSFLRGEA